MKRISRARQRTRSKYLQEFSVQRRNWGEINPGARAEIA